MTESPTTDRENGAVDLGQNTTSPERFAYMLAHDLKNPLNVAMGELSLARENVESDHLDAVALAHDRINAILEDYLALAREGSTVVDTGPVDLAAIAEQCWQHVPTSRATLIINVERTVRGDSKRMGLLFENLMRNAVEHGGDDVVVTVGELPDGFYVEDDGEGIPEGEREWVLEAGNSTSITGTGIGSSIVQAVADAHDWDVRVTEGTDGGVRFEFTGAERAV